MKIGVDATCWWNQRGFGRMTRELLTAMLALESDHTFYLFVDQPPDDAMCLPNVEIIQFFPKRPLTDAAVANDSRSVTDMIQCYKTVASTPVDVMFFPAVYSWFPVPWKLPTVVTLHDAIAEHFPAMIFPDYKSRIFWTLKVKLAVKQSNRVMTVSNAAKNEIVKYVGVAPSVIDVISEAPNQIFKEKIDQKSSSALRLKYKLPKNVRLIVYVGGMAPHKNLAGFLQGFALAKQADGLDDVHVVLVGDYKGAGFHSNQNSLQQMVDEDERLRGAVHFTGFVSDAELVVIYNDALAAAMPSFSEGFGLPAVEAMACGTPVLSSDQGSLPEVIAQGGIYFDPWDIEAISRAIVSISTDAELRANLAGKAVSRASEFSWPRAAKSALNYLAHVGEK